AGQTTFDVIATASPDVVPAVAYVITIGLAR
ncbi:hypothetical protein LCGC14_2513310, partial [marine sediment metagenome]